MLSGAALLRLLCGRAGLGGRALRRDITLAEVARHNTPEDAWLALRGKVRRGATGP